MTDVGHTAGTPVDCSLTREEVQRLYAEWAPGGTASSESVNRGRGLALRRLIGHDPRHRAPAQLMPIVTFDLKDMRQRRPHRGRPSALDLHTRRGNRCALYLAIAWAAREVLAAPKDRKSWVRRRRAIEKAARASAVHAGEQERRARKAVGHDRDYRRQAPNNLFLNLDELLERFTRLGAEARHATLEQIWTALKLGPAAALRQRRSELPRAMKARARTVRRKR
jgi:hypothetical protein